MMALMALGVLLSGVVFFFLLSFNLLYLCTTPGEEGDWVFGVSLLCALLFMLLFGFGVVVGYGLMLVVLVLMTCASLAKYYTFKYRGR